MQIPHHIFKAYDIRGLVDGELSEELAYRVGRAFVAYLRSQESIDGKKIVVGHDMRPTSTDFQTQVIRAILEEGIDVVDIGLVSTPLFNFACAHYDDHAGGIMVTASHNPAEYNGFKLTRSNGMAVGVNCGMEQIRDFVSNDTVALGSKEILATVEKKNVLSDYMERIFSLVSKSSIRPMKVVVDFGNGMGSVSVPEVLKQLPVETTYLYETPDGTFPNHEANPLKTETLRDLQKKVLEVGADFGFALDGDADRVGFVDEKGDVVAPSFVTTLIGLEVLRTHPGADMLYGLQQSMIVPETWTGAGAKHVEKCPVGHAKIKKIMKERDFTFAGELSLHLFFHDMYDLEATDLSLLYVLQLLSREQKPLSELVSPLKKYVHSGERNFSAQGGFASGGEGFDKEKIVKQIEENYKINATEVSHLDGLWMSFDWGWFNVRASNTEPLIRINLEAKTEEVMQQKLTELQEMINPV